MLVTFFNYFLFFVMHHGMIRLTLIHLQN